MKKKYSIWTVVGISFLTAITVASLIAWSGGVKRGRSEEIVSTSRADPNFRPAAWFEAQPASFADLAEKVSSAVVNVSTSKRLARRQMMMPFPHSGPQDPFDDFFEKFFEGMPREQLQRSLGSGFIIDKNGTILTNNHVVSQADDIEVGLSDGRKFKAKVVGTDAKTDIAVIRIKAEKDLPFVTLGTSKTLRPGDWVMAIGNPFGLDHTVTVGVVSAIGRLIGGAPTAKFIQTDASINPGNSGGPLFNMKGEVVGINTMMYAGGQGIGFSIPIDLAKNMAPQLIEKGVVSRGWLGVAIQEINEDLAKSFGLKGTEKGALIADVTKGSPAEKAGVQRGDIVIKFNGEKVEEPYDLSVLVGEAKPNSKATITILRNGKEMELTADVGVMEGEKAKSAEMEEGREAGKSDELGLVVRSLNPEEARAAGVPGGVVVTRVEPESAAEMRGIQPGDVVLEINGKAVGSLDEYKAATKEMKGYARILIKRDNSTIFQAFPIGKPKEEGGGEGN